MPAATFESGNLGTREFALSGAVHVIAGIFIIFLTFVANRSLLLTEVTPVELVFGIEEELHNVPDQAKVASKEVVEPEAEKARETLPQLPKQLAINSEEAPKDAIPPLDVPTPVASVAPVMKAVTPPPGIKVMKAEEVLQRLEKEQRKVGDKDKDGKKKPSDEKKDKGPEIKFDLPPPPIAQDIPKAPKGMGPIGSLEGKVNAAVKDAYQVAAANHIKRIWKLPETARYNPNLFVLVVFDIDTFGKIVGGVNISESSGDSDFDKDALAAVVAGAPYPDLPAELAPRMRLRVRLVPQDAKR